MLKKLVSLIVVSFSLIVSVHAKVILITGASGDIGLALAKHFVKDDNIVICHYASNKEDLERLQKENPEKIFLISADFSKPEDIEIFWNAALKHKDKIDVVINSAGIEKEDTSFEQIQKTLNINYLSARLICDLAIEHFKKYKLHGIIINLGSRAVYRGMPKGYYTYADAKAALTKYSQDIARDNAKDNISVYVIAPGPVEGKMFQNLREDIKAQCLSSMPTGKPVKVQEVVDIIDLCASGKIPSSTGGVFDLMGASWTH